MCLEFMQNKYRDKNSFGSAKEQSRVKDAEEVQPFPINKRQDTLSVKIQREGRTYEDLDQSDISNFKEEVEPYTQPIPKVNNKKVEYDDFGRIKKTKETVKKQSKSKVALGWFISIVIAICIAIVVRVFVFEIILVDGESMYPTLNTDQRVAVEKVSRYFSLPKRGDVIIVLYPDKPGTYVKRVIGTPGETVEVRDSTVYIDGVPLEEDYINKEPYMDMAATIVPKDSVFVMGDNRAHSLDSRTDNIGPIPKDSIIGHGTAVIWPLSEMHIIQK